MQVAQGPAQRGRGLARKGIVGEVGLKAPALPAAAQRAIKLHLGMAQFQPHSARATIDAVADDQTHAHAMFDGHDREIRQGPASAEPQFGQRQDVGIIVDMQGQAEPRGEGTAQVDVAPRKQGRPGQGAGIMVDQPRQPRCPRR